MRIVVLTTTSRVDPSWVEGLLAALPDDEDLALSIVALTRPQGRLPVSRCLVVGRSLRPGRAVREIPVAGSGRPRQSVGRRQRALARADRILLRTAPRRWSADNAVLFATGATWSRAVREEVAKADFVIAHDYNTTWAAWLLARRVPGPHVVFQTEGVHLKLAELAASAHDPSSAGT
jgi:hypothetical protein